MVVGGLVVGYGCDIGGEIVVWEVCFVILCLGCVFWCFIFICCCGLVCCLRRCWRLSRLLG